MKREFNQSSKLNNVAYDIRGPVMDEAMRMEARGAQILKLNIGNPAPFGFFAPDEVSQIWLTFSDPQLKSENARLTSPLFLERYRRFLSPGGRVHLKTDSRFLHEYTLSVVRANNLPLLASSTDIYAPGTDRSGASLRDPSQPDGVDWEEVTGVQTFYESMFLKMGLPITYMAFTLDGHDGPFVHPTDFDSDYWRAAEGPRRTFSHSPKSTK